MSFQCGLNASETQIYTLSCVMTGTSCYSFLSWIYKWQPSLQWMSTHLHHFMENTGWSSRFYFTFSQYTFTLHEPTFLCFRTKRRLKHHSCLEDADQSRISSYLAASRRCMRSVTDKVCYFLRRLSAPWLQLIVSLYRNKLSFLIFYVMVMALYVATQCGTY